MKKILVWSLSLILILNLAGCSFAKPNLKKMVEKAEQVEAGFVDGTLRIKADDKIIDYDTRDPGIGTLTKKDLLDMFTTETKFEGVVWEVYSTEEYPDLSVVIIISGTNSSWTYHFSEVKKEEK